MPNIYNLRKTLYANPSKAQTQESTFLPEELPDLPGSGLEGDVSHQDLGSFLFLGSLLLSG